MRITSVVHRTTALICWKLTKLESVIMPFDSAYILLNFAHDPAEFPSKSFVRSFRKFARFA